MNRRLPLLVMLLAGCPDPSDGGPTSGNTSGEATSQTGDTAIATDPTGSPDTDPAATGSTTHAPSTGEDTSVGDTTSSSGTTGTTDNEDTGSSDTGQPGSTGDTTTGDTTTGACAPEQGPAPVVLGLESDQGAPAAYVVLTKAGVTNVPGTVITGGDVGVSPIAAAAITGFDLALDPSGSFATSPAVAAPGRVYAADYAAPTPTLLTTAVLGMEAAYADAAARIPTDYLDLASGDLGGLTLAPGIYTWGSTVLIPADVTLSGCDDDVWIFQIAGDLDVAAGKQVLLAGGAAAHNVFWQIAGQATLHTGAHLEGILLVKTGITLQTTASLHGRAYAQTMVALDMNAVTAP